MPVQPSTDCEVLIAGAGPVGMTLALALRELGLQPRIIDRAQAATDKSKALVLWGRTLELFDKLNIADEFVRAGMYVNGTSFFSGQKRFAHIEIQRDDTAFARPLMIPQNETERILGELLAARGVVVERSTELAAFTENANGHFTATLRIADGREEQVTTPWLIGCDGAHSTVRKTLGIEFGGEFEPNDWFLADVHVEGPIAADELSIFLHRAGAVVFFPISPGRYRVIADLGTAANTAKPADPTLADVERVIAERGAPGVRVYDPVWLSGFRIHERMVNEYGRGRALLAGDAAHIHSPAGGQGMNTGMQDAFNLAWKLALVHSGQAKPELLETYSQERSDVGKMVLRNAAFMTRMATLRNSMLQFVRNHMAAFFSKLPAVQERAVAALTEMAVHYPESPLSGDDAGKAWDGTVAAGDRLPDASVCDVATGESTRLLAKLRGLKYSLLLMPSEADAGDVAALVSGAGDFKRQFPQVGNCLLVLPAKSNSLPASDVATVIDSQNEVRTRLGLRGTAVALVRPDGYVAFRGGANSWENLLQHVAGTLRWPSQGHGNVDQQTNRFCCV